MAPSQQQEKPAMLRAVEACKRIATIVFRLGREHRASFHEDARTPESDTDHTVMLGVAACAFAARYMPALDVGKIAQYALVHELVEAYAGDTMTLKVMSAEDMREKQAREEAALRRIAAELGDVFPWVVAMIGEYEAKATPEARYVKAFDKHMGALSNIVNGAVTLRTKGLSKAEVERVYVAQAVHAYAADLPEVLQLRDAILGEMYAMTW